MLAWLKDTEANTTQEWVSRAVGMDSVSYPVSTQLIIQWVPEGQNRHSQSVIDLFEFIRGSVKVVLQDLPLSEYKRAVYLIDLSKVSRALISELTRPDDISRCEPVLIDSARALCSGSQSRQTVHAGETEQAERKGRIMACKRTTSRQIAREEEARGVYPSPSRELDNVAQS